MELPVSSNKVFPNNVISKNTKKYHLQSPRESADCGYFSDCVWVRVRSVRDSRRGSGGIEKLGLYCYEESVQ